MTQMGMFFTTYTNTGSFALSIRGEQIYTSVELTSISSAGIVAGRLVHRDAKFHINRKPEGDLEIVSHDPGPFNERLPRTKSYIHVFTGVGEEFEQFADALLAIKDGRPLYRASREFSDETFARRR